MLAKFAEDDRIEQMNAQKRRMKQLEHKRAVEKLLDDRRAQFIKDRVSITLILATVSYSYIQSQYHAHSHSLVFIHTESVSRS